MTKRRERAICVENDPTGLGRAAHAGLYPTTPSAVKSVNLRFLFPLIHPGEWCTRSTWYPQPAQQPRLSCTRARIRDSRIYSSVTPHRGRRRKKRGSDDGSTHAEREKMNGLWFYWTAKWLVCLVVCRVQVCITKIGRQYFLRIMKWAGRESLWSIPSSTVPRAAEDINLLLTHFHNTFNLFIKYNLWWSLII